jgi:hypothetical protein
MMPSAYYWNTLNFMNDRTLKGTFFDNYKPHTHLCNVVELYMKKVNAMCYFFRRLVA